MKFIHLTAILALFAFSAACKKKEKNTEAVVVTANGNITASINEFRSLLGATLNTTPGAIGGRREINWDGVPDSMMHQKLPFDFFNPVRTEGAAARLRGLTYTELGSFMISNAAFDAVNDVAASEFEAFSGNKVFANTDASLWDIAFEVPGTKTPAGVKGFGAVFVDVDVAAASFVEFFNGTNSLGRYYVPVQNSESKFSFLGVYFPNDIITSVRIGHNGTLKNGQKDVSQGGTHDLIVLDDFFYSEPVAY